MRETIEIQGARENNLKDVSLEIPRDSLVVFTGVSGSGKSSLAFDTLYAEGQRRLMASMSAFARRFATQLKKPDVDVVQGLSPVVSIDQKTVAKNPRSTVGTMTDINDYLRALWAALGQAHCPDCGEPIPALPPRQIAEHVAALPAGTKLRLLAPAWRPFDEDWESALETVRVHGYREIVIAGEVHDLGAAELPDPGEAGWVDVILDTFVAGDGVDRHLLAALEHGRKIGDGLFSFELLGKVSAAARKRFSKGFGCKQHGRVAHQLHHAEFTFNDASGACRTCSGLGTAKRVWPPLLTPDPSRTLRGGAFLKEALNSDKNSWGGRAMATLAHHHDFSLDVPWQELPEAVHELFFRGCPEPMETVVPADARQGQHHAGKPLVWQGLVPQIEGHYRYYRKHGDTSNWMEDYLQKVMVEYACPECEGGRLKPVRRLVTVGGRSLPEACHLDLQSLLDFLEGLELPDAQRAIAEIMLREVTGRLRVLIDIGLDYLQLDRTSGTLSGGEAQRIRLSTQIGSGLMGMLYVLDEPSIGLHPKDNSKMIATLQSLRELGNTVVVVEHDEDTIRAADFVVEMGPAAGIHGGEVVATGTPEQIAAHEASLTGAFLAGRRSIPLPETRRKLDKTRRLRIEGARHNNLKDVTVELPLGGLVCVTGASGSGKSSLVHDTLAQELRRLLVDSRTIPGEHDALVGAELIDDLVIIDQAPIGRSPRSNPATYIGFYDAIRKVFAGTELAKQRGWGPARFSFNVKGGRCEECAGDGTITTKLSFMPDVRVTCPTCKGARYHSDTLEVSYRGRSIAEVLDMSIEEGVAFFSEAKAIHRKLKVLDELGLGYLEIGHPAPLLSGGEAQRVKLAEQLGKLKRSKHVLYILDEPTTGLHLADIGRLLGALDQLIERGHTVLVIEHNLEVIKTADWVIDLGPEGGRGGGEVLVSGPPETIAKCKRSHTGRHLEALL